MRNNNNKGSRSNVNKHELVYGESSSNARDAPMSVYHLCYCLQSLYYCYSKKFLVQKPHSKHVRKPYRPLLLFNISLHISKHDTIIIKSSKRPIYAGLQL